MAVASFLITFREAIEAALIIAILVAYLSKVGRNDLRRYVWAGSAAAVALSAVIGLALAAAMGSLEGAAEKLFEGSASLLAAAVLTSVVLWMAKNSGKIKGDLQQKLDSMVTRKFVYGIALLSFIAVFREGIETVLFLVALAGEDPAGTLYGLAAGLAGAATLALLVIRGSVRMPAGKFFRYTSIILIIFAAGLLGYSVHEYMEAAELLGYDTGFLGSSAYDINPPPESLFHEKGPVGGIFRSLVGYDGNPEWLRVAAYLGYWAAVGLYVRREFRGASQAVRPERMIIL